MNQLTLEIPDETLLDAKKMGLIPAILPLLDHLDRLHFRLRMREQRSHRH